MQAVPDKICPQCKSTIHNWKDRYCKLCGAMLPPAPTINRNVNVVDDSKNISIQGEVRNSRIVQGNSINLYDISVEDPFIVHPQGYTKRPIYPSSLQELENDIRIGQGAIVDHSLFSTQKIFVQNQVIINKAMYADKEVRIGNDCTIYDSIFCDGDCEIGANVRMDSSNSGHTGIATRGSIRVGNNFCADYIYGGEDVFIGKNARIDHIYAKGNLNLGEEGAVRNISVNGDITLHANTSIWGMAVLIMNKPPHPDVFPLHLSKRKIDADNIFVLVMNRLHKLSIGDAVPEKGVVVITTELNFELLAALEKYTGQPIRIDINNR